MSELPYYDIKIRRFEPVIGAHDIVMPKRSTAHSAGYDFYAKEDTIIQPSATIKDGKLSLSPTLVKTGVKAYMQPDEVLLLFDRSSAPKKLGLVLANSVGVVDADYYGNESNDGEIGFLFYNMKAEPVVIHKGDKIGQGMFILYLITDDDNASGIRTGGIGSTGV